MPTGPRVSDGQWHTLSCSFDRDGSMRLYTDGVFSAEEDISGIGNLDVGEGWYFGSDIDGGYSYTGAIAEVRLWHGVLDDATILDWHCSALTEAHPAWEALQGHWQLTEGAGTDIGSAANAELTGTADGTLWQVPESLIIFDYSNTPRIVDVAVTALDHMCVTIDPANLAGISWIDGCNSADVFDTDRCFIDARIFPNPGSDPFRSPVSPPVRMWRCTTPMASASTNPAPEPLLDTLHPAVPIPACTSSASSTESSAARSGGFVKIEPHLIGVPSRTMK